ncbi:receptor-type tyrosine-protein phosphatase delta-like isoform X2 [Photinus pyralis]|uniref:receptor-type tyrosine-protein phosphatase delta-like isoform X2 n=1 Tax=Photinus pyralis TaxID=7054 RepID=UPI00126726D2|nr:receptor-type tyrosine-protein phosphatase delta-like isoform X2 [Photinus pyralis]
MMCFYYSFGSVLLLFGSTFSQRDIAVVLQKSTTESKYNATCVIAGEGMSSAVSWITRIPSKEYSVTNIVSEFIPKRDSQYNCNIDRKHYRGCVYYWTDSIGWESRNSLNGFLGPVLDRRWEKFTTLHTDGSLKFKELATISNYKRFQIHISIRTLEAHIYLCDHYWPPYGNCYWIIIGGWGGYMTGIRKCETGKIPTAEDKYPKGPCGTLRSQKNHTNERVLDTSKWSHFTIRRTDNNILFYKVGDQNPMLNYTDEETSSFETKKIVVVSRKKIPGYWRVHDYDYSTTNKVFSEKIVGEEISTREKTFCASFFVAMCSKCRLTLEVLYFDGTVADYLPINQITISSKGDRLWQEERITAPLLGISAKVRLRASGACDECKNPFWSVDYFELCSENEIRVLTADSLDLTEVSCEVIKTSLQVSYTGLDNESPRESTCSNGRFGKACFSCSEIFGPNKFNCDKSTICEIEESSQNVCRCAKGYTGYACEDPCPHNTYGFKCQETCGYCSYPPCNIVTGYCSLSACLHGFGDPQCKLPPSPILQYPPVVLIINHTSIVVQLLNVSYDGNAVPIFYKIQYKTISQTEWNNSENIDFRDQLPFQIKHLEVLTSYLIRAVLITADNSSFEGVIVPYVNVTTTCEYIQMDRISIQTFNESALITFSGEGSCPASLYRLGIDNQIITSNMLEFEILRLKPYRNYTARLFSIISDEFQLMLGFQTQEGAPERVDKLNASPIDESTLEISWNLPLVPNGRIRHYEVSYEHINYLGCYPDAKIPNNSSRRTLRESSNVTRLLNVIPYSQYRITVVPYTIMSGESATIDVDTLPSAMPNEAEVPSIKTIESQNTSIRIYMNRPHCTMIRGLLDYYVTFHCLNSWCPTQSPSTLNLTSISSNEPIALTDLLSYSNYTVSIDVGRKNGRMSKTTGMVAVVRTEPSVPNPIKDIVIFSKDESSISFRFLPPYPPTGILAEIFVSYCHEKPSRWSTTTVCESSYIPLQECTLWPSYLCITLKNLIVRTAYELEVRAKNIGTLFNQPTRIFATTVQEAPEAPQNVSAAWDDYYNLTLSWSHPSITNGPLTGFFIKIYAHNGICLEQSIAITEREYQLSYQYVVLVNDSCYASKLDIYVHSFNIMFSPGLHLTQSSPPKTPNIRPEPAISAIANDTVSVDIQGVSNLEDTVQMFIFVSSDSDEGPNQQIYPSELWRKAKIPRDLTTWMVADLNITTLKTSTKIFVIGDDRKSTSLHLQIEIHNKPLLASTNYVFTILIISAFDGLKRHNVYTLNATTIGSKMEEGSANYGLFALLLLLLVPVIWIGICYYRKKKSINWNTLVTMVHTGGRNSTNPDVIPLTTEKIISQPRTLSPVSSIKRPEIPSKSNSNKIDNFSKPIKIVEFEKYVKDSIENGELEKQHQLFPRGQTKPWDYGVLPQNKPKNRYNNLIAYDHTRVKLQKLEGDEFSDYINANYIEGYKTSNGYIATQGPKPTTVVDFWRMIWQENVNYIVMLANVIEGGKKKTEQYWPNLGESLVYGDVQIDYLHSEIYADYEYRTFAVQCKNEERTVEQLHFVSWPDHGVPLYSQSLVPFLRKLLTIPQGKAPVVVHCSAGVGRTGTIILCDLCLRMAAREGVVDVLKHQHNLRQQRANLVDNVEQYKLAHLVLLECLIAPQTNLPCDDSISKAVEKIIDSNSLQHHMEYLRDTEWQDHVMQASLPAAPQPEWANKNRFEEIVPSIHGRVYLTRYPVSDEHSDYINSVEVDGFRAPQRFIVTQQPLPHTVSDFWRMVDEKEVTTIISLNKITNDDIESCLFWPTQHVEEINPVPYLKIKYQNKTKQESFSITTLHLRNNKNKKSIKRVISLISFKRWAANEIVPTDMDGLLKLWEETDRVSRGQNSPTVVTCHNGSTACGLFLALAFLIEKINLEQQCDVCLAVRTVRRNRKQFVSEKEQFVFLYRAALLYLSGFSLYSNFSPASTSNK